MTFLKHKSDKSVFIILSKNKFDIEKKQLQIDYLTKAKDDLELIDFKTPEEYLELDDYAVWTMLKKCQKSRKIIKNLEKRKLLKCVYEQTFYERDGLISRIFDVEEVRNKIRDEIAEKAGVEKEKVLIDVPTVPSVPYRHSILMEPMEIPIIQKTRDGRKIPRRLTEVSGIFEVLRGFMNILRVYTEEEHLKEVQVAAEKLFGNLPSTMRISY